MSSEKSVRSLAGLSLGVDVVLSLALAGAAEDDLAVPEVDGVEGQQGVVEVAVSSDGAAIFQSDDEAGAVRAAVFSAGALGYVLNVIARGHVSG
jgi:uncharacterized protein (DUF2141 family)